MVFHEHMKIVLVNLPVHIPTVMPYSIAMMNSVLISQLDIDIEVLDLNADYHLFEFKEFYHRIVDEEYFTLLDEFVNKTRLHYQRLSKAALAGEKLPHYDALLQKIIRLKPDAVAFSMAYNSQVFFGKPIIRDLRGKGINVILGGPADYSQIKKDAMVLSSYSEMTGYLVKTGAKKHGDIQAAPIDFSIFDKDKYFSKNIVYPLRTSISCPYRRCAFCTHHQNNQYHAFDLQTIKDAIIHNKMKKVCFIDDDFALPHLEKLASIIEPLHVEWWCQLRPIKGIIPLLPKLHAAGLRSAAWGIESGCQKMLDKIEKGTNLEDIESVLAKSKESGIRNIAYVMFGFPGETADDARMTISFLRKNKKYIDLISPSTFGLQRGSRMFEEPSRFGIKSVSFAPRILLGDKIEYIPKSGMTQEEAETIKKRYLGEMNNMDKVPRVINACKEQILNIE